jgi:hypothetical protein
MNAFLTVLRDEKRGSDYRHIAGVNENIPTEGTFSNFRKRIGTLYPSWARDKGCTWFCDECSRITVPNVIDKVRQRILYRLDNMPKKGLGKDIRVYAECPSQRFPKDVKKPKIELFSFRVAVSNSAGNAEEGDYLIINNKQIRDHHKSKTAVDCADSKYDSLKNYKYIREQGSIPIIDCNRRNEKLSPEDLRMRGYDQLRNFFCPLRSFDPAQRFRSGTSEAYLLLLPPVPESGAEGARRAEIQV